MSPVERSSVKPVRYHLRFQVLPGPNVERDARTLAAFCKEHAIEEVVLFFACEEWNDGLLTVEQEDRWFDTIARAKPILEKAGLSVSLNPWATVLHCASGRRLPADRGLKHMVSPLGEVNPACASFADPAWRKYLINQYGRFAALGPRVLWIEDDFRYHNHRPCTWGGGFEPGMLARFGKKLGRRVTREQVVRNILRPGPPHPWRALWLATWREAQLEAAAGVAQAVAVGSPVKSRLGLMSTGPIEHGAEGRDWGRLFDAMSIDAQVAHRSHFRGYGLRPGREAARNILMFDIQRLTNPPGCELAPEIENYPFTRWGHSDSRTFLEMCLSLMYGADALLLDVFPFAGNPADREPLVGRMLDECRPALAWVARRFDRSLITGGVGLPYRQDAAEHVRTEQGKSMFELHVSPFQAGELLVRYGVPCCFSDQPVMALFGQIAWVFDDAHIRRMVAGGLLLEGTSAHILCQRGFGPDIGVDVPEIQLRERDQYALEEVTYPRAGAPLGHFLNVNRTPELAVLKPRRGARAWTRIITAGRKVVGGGLVTFANRRGGRVVSYAVCDPVWPLPMDFHRQRMIQTAVDWAAGGALAHPTVTGGAHLMPIHFRGAGRQFLVVFSESDDPSRPVIRLPATPSGAVQATLLAPLKPPRAARVSVRQAGRGAVVASQVDLPHLGALVLQWPGDRAR